MAIRTAKTSPKERTERAKRGFAPIPQTMVVIYRRVQGKSRPPHLAKKFPKNVPPEAWLAIPARTVGEALAALAVRGEDLRQLDLSVPSGERHQTWRSLDGFTPAGRDISGSDLTGNNLGTCPNWRGVNARDVTFGPGTIARDIDATGARFDGSIWTRVDATGSCFEAASFVAAKLTTVEFGGTIWVRPPQARIVHDLEISKLLPAALPSGDPFAYSSVTDCRWKEAILAPDMERARRFKLAEILGVNITEGVKGAVTSAPVVLLAGAALQKWGGGLIEQAIHLTQNARQFFADPGVLLPEMFQGLTPETAGGALAIGFAIGASALVAMGARAVKEYAHDKWMAHAAPALNETWANLADRIKGHMSEEVIERLNFLLLTRSKRLVRELQKVLNGARERLPGVFSNESGKAFRVDAGYVILCEAPHLEAAQYEMLERISGRGRGAREGAICLAFPENAGTSAPVALLWHADGQATAAIASNSGKRMRLIHYDQSGNAKGVFDSADQIGMNADTMAEKKVKVPSLGTMVRRLHPKIEEILARTPTSERAPSLGMDNRLDLEYDPSTHYATCSAGRVVIRSRATGHVDNPIDYAVATYDPSTGNAAFLPSIDGVAGVRLHAKKGQPRPPLKKAMRASGHELGNSTAPPYMEGPGSLGVTP